MHPETMSLLQDVPANFRVEEIEWLNATFQAGLPQCIQTFVSKQADGTVTPAAFLKWLIDAHLMIQSYYWGDFGEGGLDSMCPQTSAQLWGLLSPFPDLLPQWVLETMVLLAPLVPQWLSGKLVLFVVFFGLLFILYSLPYSAFVAGILIGIWLLPGFLLNAYNIPILGTVGGLLLILLVIFCIKRPSIAVILLLGLILMLYLAPGNLFFDPIAIPIVSVKPVLGDWGEFDAGSEFNHCMMDTLVNSANMRRPEVNAAFVIRLNSLLQLIEPHLIANMFIIDPDAEKDKLAKERLMVQLMDNLPVSLRTTLVHNRRFAAYEGWNNWMNDILNFLGTVGNGNMNDNRGFFKLVTGETVTRMEGGVKDGNAKSTKIAITTTTNAGTTTNYQFDVAIVTSRPRDTREFVVDPILKELFSEKYCPTYWTRSVLVETSTQPKDEDNHILDRGFWIMDPYATWTGTNPPKAQNYYTGCNKQNNGTKRWVCFANADANLSPEKAFDFVRPQMKNYGYGNITHINEQLVNWPVFARANTDFYHKLRKVQGKNNIFIGGEIMSGPTLELIIDYVSKAVPYWFRVVLKP